VAKLTNHRTVSKGGDVLTERVVEALSAEAEAGYDLSQASRQRVGRPSLETGVSPRVSFRTSRSLYEAAREQAASQGRSISELAREALERAVRSGR
jgi:predicted HicB family RNase H-like nuclease